MGGEKAATAAPMVALMVAERQQARVCSVLRAQQGSCMPEKVQGAGRAHRRAVVELDTEEKLLITASAPKIARADEAELQMAVSGFATADLHIGEAVAGEK